MTRCVATPLDASCAFGESENMTDRTEPSQTTAITSESDARENDSPRFDGSDWQGGQNSASNTTTPKQRLAKPWKPGTSGNPGGRPRLPAEVRSAAQGYTPSALKRLAALAGLSLDGKLVKPTGTPAVQLGAAQTLLDRAWGRAEQALHLSTDDGARLPTLDSAGLKRLLTAIAALEADEAAIDVTPDSPAVAPDTEKP